MKTKTKQGKPTLACKRASARGLKCSKSHALREPCTLMFCCNVISMHAYHFDVAALHVAASRIITADISKNPNYCFCSSEPSTVFG